MAQSRKLNDFLAQFSVANCPKPLQICLDLLSSILLRALFASIPLDPAAVRMGDRIPNNGKPYCQLMTRRYIIGI